MAERGVALLVQSGTSKWYECTDDVDWRPEWAKSPYGEFHDPNGPDDDTLFYYRHGYGRDDIAWHVLDMWLDRGYDADDEISSWYELNDEDASWDQPLPPSQDEDNIPAWLSARPKPFRSRRRYTRRNNRYMLKQDHGTAAGRKGITLMSERRNAREIYEPDIEHDRTDQYRTAATNWASTFVVDDFEPLPSDRPDHYWHMDSDVERTWSQRRKFDIEAGRTYTVDGNGFCNPLDDPDED